MKKLILASSSPRRSELLGDLNIDFEVITSNVDETLKKGEKPIAAALRLSKLKALAVKNSLNSSIKLNATNGILSADTIVFVGKKILGKPKDYGDAFAMLKLLSGRCHKVVSGCCYIDSNGKVNQFYCVSKVFFRKLSDSEIAAALAFNEWADAAGGYKVQGRGKVLVEKIDGSLTNIIGLPTANCNK